MIRNTIGVEIARPLDAVFSFTVDPAKTPLWVSSVEKEWVSDERIQVGTLYQQIGRSDVGPQEEVIYRVVAYELNKLFVLEGVKGKYLPKTVTYTYEPIEGGTRLVYDEVIGAGSLSDERNASLREELQSDLQRLKLALESLRES
jgi:uncharacterized protein YndB with AHSA1/START domain